MALDPRNMSPCLLCRVNASAKKIALSLRARVRGVPPGATVIAESMRVQLATVCMGSGAVYPGHPRKGSRCGPCRVEGKNAR